MPNSKQIELRWKRVFRTANGEVFVTLPYRTKEALLRHEPEDISLFGNEWCGEPFSYEVEECGLPQCKKASINGHRRATKRKTR